MSEPTKAQIEASEKCPVCGGKGTVFMFFTNSGGCQIPWFDDCSSCDGRGWVSDDSAGVTVQ